VAIEQTLILAKPDAVERNLAGEILATFERRGLNAGHDIFDLEFVRR